MDLRGFIRELRLHVTRLNSGSDLARHLLVAADLLELHANRVVDMDAAIQLLEDVLLAQASRTVLRLVKDD